MSLDIQCMYYDNLFMITEKKFSSSIGLPYIADNCCEIYMVYVKYKSDKKEQEFKS